MSVERIQQLAQQVAENSDLVHLRVGHEVKRHKHQHNSSVSDEIGHEKIYVWFCGSHLCFFHYLKSRGLDWFSKKSRRRR